MSLHVARLRPAAIALAMMPPWVAYLLAAFGWPGDAWLDADALTLGMQVEWVSAPVFPVLAGIAIDPRPVRAVRVAISLACAAAVTVFVWNTLGQMGAGLLWLGGGVTYLGWLWARPGEVREETLAARAVLTIGCAFPVMVIALVLAAITGAEGMLVLGFVYFLTLHVLDASGTHARFARWLGTYHKGPRGPTRGPIRSRSQR